MSTYSTVSWPLKNEKQISKYLLIKDEEGDIKNGPRQLINSNKLSS